MTLSVSPKNHCGETLRLASTAGCGCPVVWQARQRQHMQGTGPTRNTDCVSPVGHRLVHRRLLTTNGSPTSDEMRKTGIMLDEYANITVL